MTYLEKFKSYHPNAPMDSDGSPKACLYDVGYEKDKDCNCMTGQDCAKCWNREIPTYREVFFKAFPNAPKNRINPTCCPSDIGFNNDTSCCADEKGYGCDKCWSQIINC